MTAEQFAYWLQGYAELTTDAPTPEQWKAIKEHLSLVFTKVTPAAPGTLPTYMPIWQEPYMVPAIGRPHPLDTTVIC